MTRFFGSHRVAFEEPDLVAIQFHGRIEGHEAAALVGEVVVWARTRPYSLVLIPLDGLTNFSGEARRIFVSPVRASLPPRALAFYGGNFAQRVSFDLLARASALLGLKNRHLFHGPDEASARAWLAIMRETLAPLAAPQPRQWVDLRP
ncbi:hypothetical protein [Polyangium aurulentum]|uniref:hypothetical protein n=1 Tax=Polyangium aurulentum TaxID=2567896 RepID=UPI0010ADD75D|nr:hypothetical protein [Polyangium aurulentum]UQA61310.1 hypothetical protein E8A73_012860 [Polyangium aurulentum]